MNGLRKNIRKIVNRRKNISKQSNLVALGKLFLKLFALEKILFINPCQKEYSLNDWKAL